MGTDITIIAELTNVYGEFAGAKIGFSDDDERDEDELASPVLDALLVGQFGRYAFLAGVLNVAGILPISPPRGLPEDASQLARDESNERRSYGYGHSWLSIDELMAFDYDQPLRFQHGHGSNVASVAHHPGATTYRQMLGASLVHAIGELQDLRFERVVFWFED